LALTDAHVQPAGALFEQLLGDFAVAAAQVEHRSVWIQARQDRVDARLQAPARGCKLEREGLVKLTVEIKESFSGGCIHAAIIKQMDRHNWWEGRQYTPEKN